MASSEFIGGPQELAEYLGGMVPVRSIYAWRSRGEGPRAYRVGRRVLFKKADVDAWLE
ncbi:MAG: helix-turn-helix domain-containing protein [Acidimicrobiia bacterium]|nr:helix-turn-helix domain-containing protein [Acidimicrobiia bacterium]